MKLISLNLQHNWNFDRHIDFLKQEQADMYCFQEIFASEVQRYEEALGATAFYAPQMYLSHEHYPDVVTEEEGKIERGIAILSRHPLTRSMVPMIDQNFEGIPTPKRRVMRDMNWILILVQGTIDGNDFTVCTTHLPVSDNPATNETSDYQRHCLQNLLRILGQHDDFILAGDINAPRGQEIYDTLAQHYIDWIPQHYETSIDNELHMVERELRYVVDGLFTTNQYVASEVAYVSGLSDHYAIRAILQKKEES